MGRVIAFVGGARSGKSRLALERAGSFGDAVAFVATLDLTDPNCDNEMRERVEHHRRARPASWRTVLAPRDLAGAIRGLEDVRCCLVDCLTLWVSNLLCAGSDQEAILGAFDRVLEAARGSGAEVVFVSNEVGCGIVPENALARAFRDVAGLVNQSLVRAADEAYWVVAGKAISIA